MIQKISSKLSIKKILLDLETRWYNSLKNGNPDYSIYDSQDYVYEVINCWENYSKSYLLKLEEKGIIKNINKNGNINTVVDLGCGVGYTTGYIALYFPTAKIYGTNIASSAQFKAAVRLGQDDIFKMVETPAEVGTTADVVFAFEYFEHFSRPIEHLEYVLDILSPKHFIIANSFNSISTGHFPNYLVDDKEITPISTSRKFNNKMREKGYKKIETDLWNDRPTYWRKSES